MKIKELISRQNDLFQSKYTLNVKDRIKRLKNLYSAIKNNEQNIAKALYADLHKSEFESYATETGIVLQEIKLHIKKLKKWVKPVKVKRVTADITASARIYPQPLGVVLIISPWNYPFQLLINPLIGAISAGNCAICKPSEFAPNTAEIISKILSECFDENRVAVVNGDKEVTKELLTHRFDHIFFTGGQQIGKIVMQAAAKHLTSVTLELGGKSPCIADEDANLRLTAKRLVWGKFVNAGQTCVAPDYVFIHSSIKNNLLELIKTTIIEFYGENPENNPDFPRIVNANHFQRIKKLMENSTIIFGGNTNEKELYISPTIIDNVTENDPVMQEEIMGPLLPVMEFTELDEVLQFINSREKPLALYYFSENKSKQQKMIMETASGGCCINDTIMHLVNHNLPFGGVGNSGLGNYHGKKSFETFSHFRSVQRQTTKTDIPLRYPPYSSRNLQIIRKILK